MSRYIEQAAVIGDKRKFISALIVPSFPDLEKWCASQGIPVDSREMYLNDPRVQKMMGEEVKAMLADFDKHEAVQKFVLLSEDMTESAGLMTPTLKVRRKEVYLAFEEEIEGMYK